MKESENLTNGLMEERERELNELPGGRRRVRIEHLLGGWRRVRIE